MKISQQIMEAHKAGMAAFEKDSKLALMLLEGDNPNPLDNYIIMPRNYSDDQNYAFRLGIERALFRSERRDYPGQYERLKEFLNE